jgi:hypothetical protein
VKAATASPWPRKASTGSDGVFDDLVATLGEFLAEIVVTHRVR